MEEEILKKSAVEAKSLGSSPDQSLSPSEHRKVQISIELVRWRAKREVAEREFQRWSSYMDQTRRQINLLEEEFEAICGGQMVMEL